MQARELAQSRRMFRHYGEIGVVIDGNRPFVLGTTQRRPHQVGSDQTDLMATSCVGERAQVLVGHAMASS